MKFRNPETGEVFDVTDGAPGAGFCYGIRCYECPIRSARPYCKKFINDHLHEAARLMGYEVVEDDHIPQVEKKEANMDKPRICEVLGVEVGEDVKYRHTDGTEENICVCEDGRVIISSLSCKMSTVSVLINAINHPDRIIRKPRFTEQEVERAKAIKVLWPETNAIKSDGAWTILLVVEDDTSWQRETVPESFFPSAEKNEVYTLDEIIGGAE